jgi:hypothetical protein
VSCYFRHIKDVLAEAGIAVTPANKKQVDRALHDIVSIEYKDCSTVWKALKQQVLADEKKRRELVSRLRDALG